MKKFIHLFLVLVLLFSASALFAGGEAEEPEMVEQDKTVEVLHWWTSGGEAAALNVLKQDLEGKGYDWLDMPVAGGGGEQAMTVLRSRAVAGNPPAAAQMLGYNILDWAELGFLGNLNDVAEAEGWDDVVPDAIKFFSKYEGNWIAAPVNVHSTNWVWANLAVLEELDIDIPETWAEYIAALEKVKASGRIALAHGGQPWQTATIFDAVVIAVGGPDFYRATMVDLDPDALRSPEMLVVFEQMALLRTFVDDNMIGRDWNLASAMVIQGDAAFQMMGDWAKGEFFSAGLVAGEDFMGFRTPGTAGTVTFNSDQFALFDVEASKVGAQAELAASVMSPSFQVAFNTVKGSVPARTDVSDAEFTIIGKNAMRELAEANRNGTLMGSMAHGHSCPAPVQNAMYDVISAHFNLQISSEEAVEQLADAVAAAQ